MEGAEGGEQPEILKHFQAGQAARLAGDLDKAAEHLFQAFELNPASIHILLEIGLLQQQRGEWEHARHCFEQALQVRPDNPQTYDAMARACQAQGHLAEAIEHWNRAVELQSDYAEAWQNLGLSHEHQNALPKAIECHQRVAELKPENSNAHRLLGMAQLDYGLHDAAAKCNRRALELAPEDPEANWQRFFLRALEGDFPGAWDDYEWRFQLPGRTTPNVPLDIPRWTGEEATHGTLLLHAEQGFGDTLQMLRYLPRIAMRVGRVELCVPAPLLPLLEDEPCLNAVHPHIPARPTADFHLPLMSLPGVFGDTLETLPSETPYLKLPAGDAMLPPKGCRRRVGLAWRGSGTQPLDRRSLPDAALEALRGAPVEWVSLQPESGAPDGFIEVSDQLTDFGATARLMSELDLVISVDTAAAHLAGALGRPTWLLLSFAPDWRWLRAGTASPWYPQMKLFRQAQGEGWGPVLARVCRELQA